MALEVFVFLLHLRVAVVYLRGDFGERVRDEGAGRVLQNCRGGAAGAAYSLVLISWAKRWSVFELRTSVSTSDTAVMMRRLRAGESEQAQAVNIGIIVVGVVVIIIVIITTTTTTTITHMPSSCAACSRATASATPFPSPAAGAAGAAAESACTPPDLATPTPEEIFLKSICASVRARTRTSHESRVTRREMRSVCMQRECVDDAQTCSLRTSLIAVKMRSRISCNAVSIWSWADVTVHSSSSGGGGSSSSSHNK